MDLKKRSDILGSNGRKYEDDFWDVAPCSFKERD
jgi:hypothetical protein